MLEHGDRPAGLGGEGGLLRGPRLRPQLQRGADPSRVQAQGQAAPPGQGREHRGVPEYTGRGRREYGHVAICVIDHFWWIHFNSLSSFLVLIPVLIYFKQGINYCKCARLHNIAVYTIFVICQLQPSLVL